MNYNPDLKESLQIALNNYRTFGAWQTFKDVSSYLLSEGQSDDFDRKYGVSTEQSVEPAQAGIRDDVLLVNAVRYVPIREPVMRNILSTVARDLDLSSFTFVDLGCGQAKALLIALRFPFRQVVGVELGAALCQVARDNVARYLATRTRRETRCRDVQVDCANAADFPLPAGDLLIYLYRPFTGPVLDRVVKNIRDTQAASGARVFVVLCCPFEAHVFDRHPDFERRRTYAVISDEYAWVEWECVGHRRQAERT